MRSAVTPLKRLVEEGLEPKAIKVVVQIVNWKAVPPTAGGGPPRARLAISDGDYAVGNAVASGNIVDALESGKLSDGGLISLTDFGFVRKDPSRPAVLVMKSAEIVAGSSAVQFGNPQPLMKDAKAPLAPTNGGGGASAAPPRAAAGGGSVGGVHTAQGTRRPGEPAGPPGGAAKKARMDLPPGMIEIQALNPYMDKFKIRALVTAKEELREWNNARGSGSLFNMELTDHSGAIRATAFKEEAQKFFPLVQQSKVYDISGGKLKPANKKYNSTKHDYELTFDRTTEMVPVTEGAASVNLPSIHYNFSKIVSLTDKQKDDMVDVIGVLKSVGEATKLTSRAGRELVKRDLTLVDDSNASVALTLWGTQAEAFTGEEGRVLAVKSVKVGDFGGVSLSTVSSSRMEINPTTERAMELAGWWDDAPAAEMTSLTTKGGGGSRDPTIIFVDFVNAFGMGGDPNKADYFNLRGIIVNCKAGDALYKACPQENCNKRVVESGGDAFRCEKCQQDYDKFKWAAMIQVCLMDLSGTHWLTLFGEESCRALTDKSPGELGALREEGREAEYETIFNAILFRPLHFRLSARQETYNDQTNVKWRSYGIRKPTPDDQDQYIKQLEAAIDLMKAL